LVMNQSNGDIEVVVAGTDPEMVDDFRNGLWEDPERSVVMEVHESNWEGPMKVGFEIRGDLKLQAEEIEEIKQKIEQTEEELITAERKQKKLYESLSWRITGPIRWFGAIAKKFREPNV